MYGLSVDNVVEIEMVLADGRIVVASEESDPGEHAHTGSRLRTALKRIYSKPQSSGGPSEVRAPLLVSPHDIKSGHSPSLWSLQATSSSMCSGVNPLFFLLTRCL